MYMAKLYLMERSVTAFLPFSVNIHDN